MSQGQFARRKNWFGGNMDPKSVDEDIRNLRLVLGNIDNGTQPWSHFTLTDTTFIPGASSVGSRSTQIFDYFDRSDRTLNGDKTPTGNTWVLSGTLVLRRPLSLVGSIPTPTTPMLRLIMED